jgi:16S rRNA (guanine966-N2)-methyltransferase
VIAGSAKGVRLGAVPPGVRPVSDRAREGLFSSIGRRVLGAAVLDLFAGTGALGIEALSRGAERATFVERAPPAVRAIRENLARTALVYEARVITAEAASFLRRADRPGAPYDLVFADPPYEDRVETLLPSLAGGWLAEGWTVVLTRPARSSTHVIPVDWALARRLVYGDSLVFLYREERWA